MSDVDNNNVEAVVESEETIVKENKLDVSSLQKEIEALRKQNQDLLTEAKKAKRARETAELEKAQHSGEYEKLWKTAEQEKETIAKEYQEFKSQWRQEKVNSQAMKVANEVAANTQAANLLTHFIKESLYKVADENGNLAEDVIEAVKKEVKNSKDYAPLVAGSRSSGGGAPGAGSGAAGVKELNMSEYNKLTPAEKLSFSKQVQFGKAKLI